MPRFIGIDAGAETIKLVELAGEGSALAWTRRASCEHHGDPTAAVREVLGAWGWGGVAGSCATGRLGRRLALERIPPKRARTAGHVWLHGEGPATIVDLGAHGFSVLTHSAGNGVDRYRENPRCSQGTGNFLRQLLERFGLDVAEADRLAAGVEGAPLSSRCPVILKTDVTHLANRGEPRERILAGLFDAICSNVITFVRPGGPPDVWLCGGVSRSRRLRERFRAVLAERGLVLRDGDLDQAQYLDALGCALLASGRPAPVPPLDALCLPAQHATFAPLPALGAALPRVRRLAPPPPPPGRGPLLLGLDIGSTGSKAVALDVATGLPAWEAYRETGGDPIGAARSLVGSFLAAACGGREVVGAGVTGSGREIVGSMLATCFGTERVFVLNEIAAHAEGAVAHDARVDTIFEIGGQDAKYIRLENGRVVEAAMNEACSAGTGSFIEEQGRRLGGRDARALGQEALAADGCVALGQHCAVFMAEILDEALAAGVARDQVVAGLYDSVVQNYLNRVKGSRSIGQVVFCQGMPFSADALAAAVARHTGAEIVIPPSPGTVGAFGIARLARAALPLDREPLEVRRFQSARVVRKDAFACRSTEGCGGAGNRCRIERLRTEVLGERRTFTWGGACTLFDRGTRTRKLPPGAPDPFQARRDAVEALVAALGPAPGAARVAMADAFQLKSLLPYFATFFRALGAEVELVRSGGRAPLREGIDLCNVAFCAPMQQAHGIAADLARTGADHLFLPMLRDLPEVADERHTWLCPIVQGAPDVLGRDLGERLAGRLLAPAIRTSPGFLESGRFVSQLIALAAQVGTRDRAAVLRAHGRARDAQRAFDSRLEAIGEEALGRCRREGLLAVVVLGRAYTIHDEVLSSNVPALLREQGVVPIPLDCFPLGPDTPLVPGAFWSYTQRILRAAHRIRRSPGVYGIFTTNFGCGPDSFTQHHLARLMEGKPFAVVETDGHTADAGTRTRVEAFLHCAREDALGRSLQARPAAAEPLAMTSRTLAEVSASGSLVLVPPMGPEAEALATVLRGAGLAVEVLPPATADTIRLGRRHTSGKECLPMIVTAGALLERVARQPDRRFTFFMPGSNGPCRFGMYRQLHQIILDRTGLADRVAIWSPPDHDYFEGVPPGLGAIVLAGVTARGVLADALRDVRPVELAPGAAAAVHDRWVPRLLEALERAASGDLSAGAVVREVVTGRLWGIRRVLARGMREMAAVRDPRPHPTVLMVGEIYVRSDPASNGWAADELERRGLRVRIEPVVEFLQYADSVQYRRGLKGGVRDRLRSHLRRRIVSALFRSAAVAMGWPIPEQAEEVAARGDRYLRPDLEHEVVLAMGLALEAWRRREVDGILCAGPLDCMPTRLMEAQLFHAAADEGMLSLTLFANGDPVDPEILDGFASEVKERFERRVAAAGAVTSGPPGGRDRSPTPRYTWEAPRSPEGAHHAARTRRRRHPEPRRHRAPRPGGGRSG